jgi:hypothetical protein
VGSRGHAEGSVVCLKVYIYVQELVTLKGPSETHLREGSARDLMAIVHGHAALMASPHVKQPIPSPP